MTPLEFSVAIATYYREPLTLNGKDNLRITAIEKWAGQFTDLDRMLARLIERYIPTSISPCPLIPHIIDICEIVTPEKSRIELARAVADRIVWAVLNIGCREEGCRDRAVKHIGELGINIIKNSYGKWTYVCEESERGSIEMLRSHLRDSALTYISRAEKGLEDKEPEMTDLKVSFKQSFLSLDKEGKICLPEKN